MKKGQVIKWRRLVPFNASMEQLVEGITPSPTGVTYEDVSSTLSQYGAWIPFTDVLIETHEDENLKQFTIGAGEQAALTKERILWSVLIAGTNVIYSGSATSRATVQAPIDLGDIQLATRALKVAMAKPITKMVTASEKIATQPVAPAFVAFGHTNLEQDFRALSGFVPRENYSDSTKLLHPMEIGKVQDVRVILLPHLPYFPGAGSGTTTGVLFTGSNVDVYPIVFLGENAFAATALKGMSSANVAVKNPKIGESYEDPLGQRGFVALTQEFAIAA
jgi:N4-gp56 family major capsid protein